MQGKNKMRLKIVFASAFVIAGAIGAFFYFKEAEEEKRAPRIAFENVEAAPVEASILPLRNHGVIYVKCIFKNAGVLNNQLHNHGISSVVADLILKRIGDLTPEETTEKLLDGGIRRMSFDASGDNLIISFYIARDKAQDAFVLLNSALIYPIFTEGDLGTTKAKISSSAVLETDTTPASRLMQNKVFELMYGRDCAYGLRTLGSSRAVARITANDVKNFINQKLSRKNLKLYFAGDVTSLTAHQYIDILLKDLPEGKTNEAISIPSFSSDSSSNVAIEHIIKKNMRKIIGVTCGIRIDDKLSKIEKAAIVIILNALFKGKDSDFSKDLRKANIVCNFYVKFLSASLSKAILLSAYVNFKEFDIFMKCLEEKMEQYASGNVDWNILKQSKQYLAKLSDNGFYSLNNIDEQMEQAYLPFDEVTEDVIKNMMQRLFQKNSIKIVTCGERYSCSRYEKHALKPQSGKRL